MKKIILFINGKFEHTPFKIQIKEFFFKSSQPKNNTELNEDIFCADGGINYILSNKISSPNIHWIGDGDSLTHKSKKYLMRKKDAIKHIQHLNTEKDFSDLAAILDYILLHYSNESLFLEIFGGLGKRRDHELANIEEVKRFLSLLHNGGTTYFHGGVILSSLPIKIFNHKNKFFSIFGCQNKIEVKGSKYSGKISLTRPSHGLSNKVIEDVLEITPTKDVFKFYLN